MPDFRVSKRRVPVKVLVADKVRDGDVFLTPIAASHDGSETLSELLNGKEPYLPLEGGGDLSCLPLDAIAVAWVSRESGQIPEPEVTPATSHQVCVTLLSGWTLRGTIRYSQHPDSSRLVDFLNAAPNFVSLHQGEEIAFLNRRHVASIDLDSGAKSERWTRPAAKRSRRRNR